MKAFLLFSFLLFAVGKYVQSPLQPHPSSLYADEEEGGNFTLPRFGEFQKVLTDEACQVFPAAPVGWAIPAITHVVFGALNDKTLDGTQLFSQDLQARLGAYSEGFNALKQNVAAVIQPTDLGVFLTGEWWFRKFDPKKPNSSYKWKHAEIILASLHALSSQAGDENWLLGTSVYYTEGKGTKKKAYVVSFLCQQGLCIKHTKKRTDDTGGNEAVTIQNHQPADRAVITTQQTDEVNCPLYKLSSYVFKLNSNKWEDANHNPLLVGQDICGEGGPLEKQCAKSWEALAAATPAGVAGYPKLDLYIMMAAGAEPVPATFRLNGNRIIKDHSLVLFGDGIEQSSQASYITYTGGNNLKRDTLAAAGVNVQKRAQGALIWYDDRLPLQY